MRVRFCCVPEGRRAGGSALGIPSSVGFGEGSETVLLTVELEREDRMEGRKRRLYRVLQSSVIQRTVL
jgi:hypothetical protein